MGRIFHIATAADWRAAQEAGTYTTSTRGRTLAEEGFIHASRGDQWPAVRERFYADVDEPLLLLVIETDLLDVPVVEEEVAGTGQTFPHVHGPLRPGAVVQAVPLELAVAGSTRSSSSLFLAEVFRHSLLGALLMVVVVIAAVAGWAVGGTSGAWAGLALGIAAGTTAVVGLGRRRRG